MSYLQSNLLRDEKIIIEGKLSKWISLKPLIIAGILLIIHLIGVGSFSVGMNALMIILFFVFIIAFVNGLIKRSTTEIMLTNKRFIRKKGLLSRNVVELRHEKIEGVSTEQGLLGKILNYGSLSVTGTGNTLYYTRGIENPLLIKEKIYKHIK